MIFHMRRAVAVASLLLSGCATAPAVSPGYQLDPATRPACAANCEKMGLKLAVVIQNQQVQQQLQVTP